MDLFSVAALQIIPAAVIIMKVIMMIITTAMMTVMTTVMIAATTAVMTVPGIQAGIRTQAGIQIPVGTPDMMTGDQTGRKI